MFRSTVEWRRVSVRSLAAMALAAIPLLGADWPQWRGPNRDGVSRETGLLQQWPEAGPALKWKATGFGDGMGTVTIAGGRVYTTGDVGDTSWLFALNEADGTHLWKAKVGKSGSPGAAGHFYGGSRGIPSVDGDRLFLLSQLGELVSFTKDGKEVWRANLVRDHGGEVPTWGYSESPLVDGDQVIVTPGGFKGAMIAFEKNTGKVLWQSKGWTDAADYSSAIVTVIGGVRQYIQQSVPTVAGISAKDGRVLGKAQRPGGRIVISTPVEKDGLVYVAAGYGAGCHAFQVKAPAKPDGEFSVSPAYANRNMKNHHGGVILLGNHIYGSNDPGILTAMDYRTGEVAWSDRSIGKGSIAVADGLLYLRSEKTGAMALVEASPAAYKLVSVFTPPDASGKSAWPHPVIAKGVCIYATRMSC